MATVVPWNCDRCSYRHGDSEAACTKCAICESPRPEVSVHPTDRSSAAEIFPDAPERCVSLASEGVGFENRAAEFDRAGQIEQALFYHKRAETKLTEAYELCPPPHPDYDNLKQFAQAILMRTFYLEALFGAPPDLPIEDYIGEFKWHMDMTRTVAPESDDQVEAVLAASGASGESAPLSTEGLGLIRALNKPTELRVFVDRILQSDNRARSKTCTDDDLHAFVKGANDFAELQKALRRAPCVELVINSADRLDQARAYEEEGKRFDAEGLAAESVNMFTKSVALFQYLIKHDPRCKNAKIREVINQRVVDVSRRMEELASKTGGAN